MLSNLAISIFNLNNFIVEVPSWVIAKMFHATLAYLQNVMHLGQMTNVVILWNLSETHTIENTVKGFSIYFTSLIWILFVLYLTIWLVILSTNTRGNHLYSTVF